VFFLFLNYRSVDAGTVVPASLDVCRWRLTSATVVELVEVLHDLSQFLVNVRVVVCDTVDLILGDAPPQICQQGNRLVQLLLDMEILLRAQHLYHGGDGVVHVLDHLRISCSSRGTGVCTVGAVVDVEADNEESEHQSENERMMHGFLHGTRLGKICLNLLSRKHGQGKRLVRVLSSVHALIAEYSSVI